MSSSKNLKQDFSEIFRENNASNDLDVIASQYFDDKGKNLCQKKVYILD
jgi:hypothetical protein